MLETEKDWKQLLAADAAPPAPSTSGAEGTLGAADSGIPGHATGSLTLREHRHAVNPAPGANAAHTA